MRRVWGAVVVLAACGRAHFDPSIGHDEDGDHRADTDDNCPWISNATQLDNDGDRVGDACDPEPGIANQIALFAPLLAGDDPFSNHGSGWEPGDDVWHCDSRDDTAATVEIPVDETTIWYGVDLIAVRDVDWQTSIIEGSELPFYYLEVVGQTSGGFFELMEKLSDTSFVNLDAAEILPSVPIGPITLKLQMSAANQTMSGASETSFGMQLVGAATPDYVPRPSFAISCRGLQLDVRYIAVVSR